MGASVGHYAEQLIQPDSLQQASLASGCRLIQTLGLIETMTPPIDNAEKLIARFGRWPSFHDAEVLRVEMGRGPPHAPDSTSLLITIHVWETATEYSDDIHYEFAHKNDTVVTFHFQDITELALDGFNLQNVIDDLAVVSDGASKKHPLKVEIESIFGLGGSFRCARAEVVSVHALPAEAQQRFPGDAPKAARP